MPKISKLCLNLSKLRLKYSGLFFPGHGVHVNIMPEKQAQQPLNLRRCQPRMGSTVFIPVSHCIWMLYMLLHLENVFVQL